MSTLPNQSSSSEPPVAGNTPHDRYFFGALDSSVDNREKLREVNWGYDQPEGIVLASLDAAINWGAQKFRLADDFRPRLLRD